MFFGTSFQSRLTFFARATERYNLSFSESGAVVVVASTVGLVTIVGPAIARGLLIRNFNAIAGAYNEYNGLVDPDADKLVDIFGDTEVEL